MDAIETTPKGPGPALARLLEAELHAIPVERWAFMFPAHVAVWKLIEDVVPGVLGPLIARFDVEPTFEGEGAEWFVTELVDQADYLNLVEIVMKSAVAQLSPQEIERGFVRVHEPLVQLTPEIEALASLALAVARTASADDQGHS